VNILIGKTMKALIALFLVALLPPVAAAKEEKWSIVQADVVVVSNQRVSDWRVAPLKITDPKLVHEIIDLFQEAKGRWKKGFATSPSGDIRFIFYRGDQNLDAIGVGDRFLVRSARGGWESKKISPELEARLRAFAEKKADPVGTDNEGAAPPRVGPQSFGKNPMLGLACLCMTARAEEKISVTIERPHGTVTWKELPREKDGNGAARWQAIVKEFLKPEHLEIGRVEADLRTRSTAVGGEPDGWAAGGLKT